MAKHGWEVYDYDPIARKLATKYADLEDLDIGDVVSQALLEYVIPKLPKEVVERILLDRHQDATATPAE